MRLGIRRKIHTFLKISWKGKWLAIQTYCLCGIVRAMTLLIPFKKIQPHLGSHNLETPEVAEMMQYKKAKQIKWIIRAVSPHTPWQSKCLVQAIVAQHLLRKRGVATTLYLGVAKSGEHLNAHAWLRCGEMIVTGGEAVARYTVISKFSNENCIKKIC